MTWEEICIAEPLLLQLESIITRADVPQEMPDYWRRWTIYKQQMEHLVGWDAINPELRTEEAYNLVHDRLLDVYERRAAELGGEADE
jgi:hypothetical protein